MEHRRHKPTYEHIAYSKSQALIEVGVLLSLLEAEIKSNYISRYTRQIKQNKIDGLTELHNKIVDNLKPSEAAKIIRSSYPDMSYCFFNSRTEKLLDDLEYGYSIAPR